MKYVIELKVPGHRVTYFAKAGGYTADKTAAQTFSDYNDAYEKHETLAKCSTDVAKYGKVTEL